MAAVFVKPRTPNFEEALKKIDTEVRAIVNDAAEFATHDAEPDPSELYTDVYQ